MPYVVHHIFWFFGTVLFAYYMLVMFRLKALQIYLDPSNEKISDIEKALKGLQCVQIYFGVFFSIWTIFEGAMLLGQ